jgi:hypothetical protein
MYKATRYLFFLALLLLSYIGLCPSLSQAQLPTSRDILTYHGDNARLGWYNDETILTPDNVNPDSFGKLWERDLGGQVYGQPLFVHNVTIRGRRRNVIYAATMTNRVHAIDAATGEWLWPENADPNNIDPQSYGIYLGPPSPYFVSIGSFCQDVAGPVGVLSTMVIDRTSNTLYVANVVSDPNERFRLHALDLSTGRERSLWPVTISGSTLGVTFDPRFTSQRGALMLLNGRVYVPFGGRCDIVGDTGYRGWLFGYAASNPAAAPYVFSPSIARSGGGLWSMGGPSADRNGNIYLVTGNRKGDPLTSGQDLSMSILRLPANLRFSPQSGSIFNYYTPSNQMRMNQFDWDLGGSSVIILPPQPDSNTPNLLFTGGKDGRVYLVNRDNLGGFGGPTRLPDELEDTNPDDTALQRTRLWTGSEIGGIKTVPAYFGASDGTNFVYVTGINEEGRLEQSGAKVVALYLTTDPDSGNSIFFPVWESDPMATNTVPVVSSNGGDNGIVWVVDANKDIPGRSGDSTRDTSILNAYDAWTGTLLYTSKNGVLTSNNLERDRLGDGRKYSTPIVRDGKVYVGTTGIVAYGLLESAPPRTEPENLVLRVDATAFASVIPTGTIGGGNRDVNAIRQGVWKFSSGWRGYTEFNTFNDTFQREVYFGIRFPTAQTFNEIDFQLGGANDGRLFADGGWFATGTVRLEYFDGTRWGSIPGAQWTGYRPGGPNRPEAPATAPFGAPLRGFDIFKARFPAVTGYAIQIIGTPGQGTQSRVAFGSCGQIRIFNR